MSAEATSYLISRAYNHGITLDDLLAMTPSSIADDMQKCVIFWEQRDISHDLPQSTHPELANDPTNMMPEDPSTNRSRGAEEMTTLEELMAQLDNEILATMIDIGIDTDVVMA